MSIEVAVLVDKNHQPLFWLPGFSGEVPDSSALWNCIWRNRDDILGVAHSHPGSGRPTASLIDVTTFSAIERGLGRRLTWWITSSDSWVQLQWYGPEDIVYCSSIPTIPEPEWLLKLREMSYKQEVTNE